MGSEGSYCSYIRGVWELLYSSYHMRPKIPSLKNEYILDLRLARTLILDLRTIVTNFICF